MAKLNDRSNSLSNQLVKRITDLKLETPAIAFLSAYKPFTFLGSQCVLLMQPVLDVFVSRMITSELVGLLGDRDRYEEFVGRLEASDGR